MLWQTKSPKLNIVEIDPANLFGAVVKDDRTIWRKIDSFLSSKYPLWLKPPPPCTCEHIINFENLFKFFALNSADIRI